MSFACGLSMLQWATKVYPSRWNVCVNFLFRCALCFCDDSCVTTSTGFHPNSNWDLRNKVSNSKELIFSREWHLPVRFDIIPTPSTVRSSWLGLILYGSGLSGGCRQRCIMMSVDCPELSLHFGIIWTQGKRSLWWEFELQWSSGQMPMLCGWQLFNLIRRVSHNAMLVSIAVGESIFNKEWISSDKPGDLWSC